jgi:CRP/FNR family transcriptional regulator, dissimilatory nitrate respiration regulator
MYDNDHMRTVDDPSLEQLLPAELLSECRTVDFAKGEMLFCEGKKPLWMFYVTHGEVALIRHGTEGETAYLQRQQKGFVGEASLVSEHYHCNAIALIHGEAIKVPVQGLKEWLSQDTNFSMRWIKMLSAEVRRARLQNERLTLPSVRGRLLHLIDTEGTAGSYHLQGSIKLLAQQLAVSYEALYRCIATLEKEGQLVRAEKTISLVARL